MHFPAERWRCLDEAFAPAGSLYGSFDEAGWGGHSFDEGGRRRVTNLFCSNAGCHPPKAGLHRSLDRGSRSAPMKKADEDVATRAKTTRRM